MKELDGITQTWNKPISITNITPTLQESGLVTGDNCKYTIQEKGFLYYRHIFTVLFNEPVDIVFKYNAMDDRGEVLGINITYLVVVEDVKNEIERNDEGIQVLHSKHVPSFAMKTGQGNDGRVVSYEGFLEGLSLKLSEEDEDK